MTGAFRAHRPMPDGGEHALDRVCRSQMVPVLGGEVVEGSSASRSFTRQATAPSYFALYFSANSVIAASAC